MSENIDVAKAMADLKLSLDMDDEEVGDLMHVVLFDELSKNNVSCDNIKETYCTKLASS